ncbi:phage portal protein [Ancylobacter radicis]|uniref:Anti-CBASS protein Acb1 n=1 Tax=Ancylobacter radicis TaxID=2836179 RepID=A0ABS5R3K9_9HYPH|nr:phage portal protein [Ancylobacter radicis]MBS9476229.1 phage portal protein [Ancylobacter radicis]
MAGFFRRLFGDTQETKSVDFSEEMWAAINGGWGVPTKSGADVSINSALSQSPFYRGVLVIADGVAQLPVEIYRSLPGGRGAEPAIDHPLYDMLLYRPSGVQDAPTFFGTIVMHAVATGNSVSYRVMVNGQMRELLPFRPEHVTIDTNPYLGETVYDCTFETGQFATLGATEVFHLRGPSWRVHKGLDPSLIGREAIGLAQATEETHSRLHKNGARPSGVLSSEKSLDKTQIELLREQWEKTYTGTENSSKTAVLPAGLKWEQIRMSGVDAEHLATRKHQIEEIARFLGVFPIMLGHAGDQSPTFASADAFLEAHVRYTLQPWIRRLTGAVNAQLLTEDERRAGYRCRIDTSELLRGSLKDRTEYYKAALGTNSSPGWLKPNEIREDDGWNPDDDPDMDQVWQPATMAPVNATSQDPANPASEAKSSTPRTLYVSRPLKNGAELLRWAKAQGFSETLGAGDLHVTLIHSRSEIDWMSIGRSWNPNDIGELVIPPGGPRVVEAMNTAKGAAIALKFSSAELEWRHEQIVEAGAVHDWPGYQPHITITYDARSVDLSAVEPYQGKLVFGPERFEEISA